MEPEADAAAPTDGAAPADPAAPAEGLGAGKSTETGGIPMESGTAADSSADSATPSMPADGETTPASN